MNRTWLVLICLFLTLTSVSSAIAESGVRVIDQKGLIRGYSKVGNTASVKVKLSAEVSSLLTLVNVDGLAGEVSASSNSGVEYQFRGVKPGTWKISQLPPHSSVSEVKVTAE